MVDPFTEEWQPEQVAAMESLRDWVVSYTMLNQHLSAWTGLPSSDANALGQIIWAAESDEPLSPAQLARLIGMTSGATTVLLNRLEHAGHVVRSREDTDRRRVTLRPTATARERAREFTAVASTEIAATLHATSTADLRVVATFLRQMTEATAAANARLSNR